MYSAFILSSFVELFVHYGCKLPQDIEFATQAMAFFVEGFLFNSHLHGKEIVEVYVHVLLVWSIAICFIFACLEYHSKRNVLFTYGRCLFTILQGTWFYQVGFMLYPPFDWFWQWDLSDHDSIMNIAVAFCWHIMLISIGLLLQLHIVKKMILNKSSSSASKLNTWMNDLIRIDKLKENNFDIHYTILNNQNYHDYNNDDDDDDDVSMGSNFLNYERQDEDGEERSITNSL